MTYLAKLARPYAKAAFEYALQHNQLDQWSTMLNLMAERMQQPIVVSVLKNPKFGAEQLSELGFAVGQDVLNQEGKNFIQLLARSRRLSALSAIAEQYAELRAAQEKMITAHVKSVIPLNDDDRTKLTNSLQAKFGRKVVLQCELDPALIGGLIIFAGDQVIDNSIRGQLQRLRETMVN